MLIKYFTWIFMFYFISPESRDLLCFYCKAFIVYNIMLLTLKSLNFVKTKPVMYFAKFLNAFVKLRK